VRARWALDHHGVAYGWSEYLPIFGEPALRLATRRLRGRLTVPVLIEGRRVIDDSFEIARHAETLGGGPPLMADKGAAAHWNAVADRISDGGRLRTTALVSRSREAKRDSLPKGLAWALPVADLGVAYLTRKYDLGAASIEQAQSQMADACQLVSDALAGDYLGAHFGYADIAIACALQFIDPVDGRYIRLGEHAAACWRTPALADRFRHLLDWRDRVFAEHR